MTSPTGSLLAKTRKLLRSGVVQKPKWFDAVAAVPPTLPLRDPFRKRPPQIVYPEDRLLARYYARHPEARLESLELWNPHAHSAWKFVKRQMEVMKQSNLSDERAFAIVEEEVLEQKRKLNVERQLAKLQATEFGVRPAPTLLQMVQAEEEKQMRLAAEMAVTRQVRDEPAAAPASGAARRGSTPAEADAQGAGPVTGTRWKPKGDRRSGER